MKPLTSLLVLLSLPALSWYFTRISLHFALRRNLLDIPNHRSSHSSPTPRTGGLAFVVLFVGAVMILGAFHLLRPVEALGLFAGVAVAAIGAWDDFADLPVHVRLPIHLVASACAVLCLLDVRRLSAAFGGPFAAGLGISIAWLALVWLINLTNFMDGIDGLAGSEALTVGGLCCALSLAAHGMNAIAVLFAVLATSVAGFLLWNWYPARLFMGDAGSGFLGFCFGALTLLAAARHLLSPFVPVILLGVFVVDASFTLGKRIARRERWYAPHRAHAFQHLARHIGHERTTLIVVGTNLFWLAPWAAVAQWYPTHSMLWLLSAWTPLVVGAQLVRAGETASRWERVQQRPSSAVPASRRLGVATLARTGGSTVTRLYRRLGKHGFAAKHVVLTALNFGCVYLAVFTRFDGEIPSRWSASLSEVALIWCLIQGAFLLFFRTSRSHWRFTSAEEIPWLSGLAVLASVLGGVMATVLMRVHEPSYIIPRSVYLLDAFFSVAVLAGIRLASRNLFGQARRWAREPERTRVLIYGANERGVGVLSELRRHCHDYRAIGFVDDRPELQKERLSGVPVLGRDADLSRLVRKYRIHQVIVPSHPSSIERERALAQICLAEKLELRVVTPIFEEIAVRRPRRTDEWVIEDLLGRPPIQLDMSQIAANLSGQVVMVTGAAGSIGSELCRQIARFKPKAILGYEINETALFYMDRQMQDLFPDVSFVPCIGSVQSRARLQDVMRTYRPDRVYHAAAYKHVPLMEQHIFEAIENNIFGTETLLRACEEHKVRSFVMISTDKAARPTSLMGVSKRVAEMLVRASTSSHLTCVSTRFGNVLGSNGSVVPIFRDQIANGGPVKVTHPAMVRFFMTIPEAAQLVLQAASLGAANEIFALDMGAPVKIVDLAERMIRLAGLTPGRDIQIEFTGMRPGEKLYEELSTFGEELVPTTHSNISIFRSETNISSEDLRSELEHLRFALDQRSIRDALCVLERLVPDYTASQEVQASGAQRPHALQAALHVA